ncbi:hypothetical protein Tco_1193027 [Tanacetum coccineum]
MFEHCFENLPEKVKARLRETRTDLVGFAGEIAKPLGKIDLEPEDTACPAINYSVNDQIFQLYRKAYFESLRTIDNFAECRLREEKQMIREETPQEEEGVDVTE